MRKTLHLFLFIILATFQVNAQNDAIVQEGEVGVSLGGGHYFGDINNQAGLNEPGAVLGVFFRKQFGGYIALRMSGHYAKLGYSDKYSKVAFQQRRNLNFETKLWEMALQGDFNFFRFIPGDPMYFFTPYVTIGVGTFNYDPYTTLNGEKYYLRKLGTEGQG